MAQAGQQAASEVDIQRLMEFLDRYGPTILKKVNRKTLRGQMIQEATPSKVSAFLKTVVHDTLAADIRAVIRKVAVQPDGSVQFTGLVPNAAEPCDIYSPMS